MSELYTAMLTDWELVLHYGVPRLKGKIIDDNKERFDDDTVVLTSRVKYINFDTMMAETKSGSIYKLTHNFTLTKTE